MTLLAALRRPGLIWLPVLLVLLARMAVAPGWMMEVGSSGSISVRICSDPDRIGQNITIPLEQSDAHLADGQQHCSWGALADTPPEPAPVQQLLALALAAAKSSAPPSPGFAPGIASPLPPSTGPPAFA